MYINLVLDIIETTQPTKNNAQKWRLPVIKWLNQINMTKKDYNAWNKDDLIAEIKNLRRRKKYGLVWEDKPEDVVEQCKIELPVLEEVKKLAVTTDDSKPTNILIEGDNYHALSVLNYTHKGKIDVIYIDPPYNTGAKDWKYNNNFVDSNDAYRHSKWLSMMANRLGLAKKLLKRDGVLICAIDENEQSHLGVLLESLFQSHEIHLISIVHNPRGIIGKNFSYTNEFAYFVIPKGRKIVGHRKISQKEIQFRNLRDNGGESLREDARNCFYPIKINPITKELIGFGDVCNDSYNPDSPNIKKGDEILIYPIDGNSIERKWRYARQTVETIKHLLRAKKGSDVWQIEIGKDFGTYRTVWQGSRYDSNEYGTKLIKKMVTDCDFDFPKSIYNTYDCIYAVIGERNNAIILDYFSGSGTTGHAVSLINKEDGGTRRFILCTNNENGIAREVCHPRIKAVIKGNKNLPDITGIASNLKYFKTTFVPAKSTDKNKTILTQKATTMLCVKEDTFEQVKVTERFQVFRNKKRHTGIIFDQRAIGAFKKAIAKKDGKFNVYVFSLSDDTFENEFEDVKDKVSLSPIPQAILRVYRQIHKRRQPCN